MNYQYLYMVYILARRELARAKGTEGEPVARAVLQRAIDQLNDFVREYPNECKKRSGFSVAL